jgi:diguanylate cyclase (GGDEF)-like protein
MNFSTRLRRLEAQTLRWLLGSSQQHRLEPGDVLFEEGEPGDRIWLLRSGTVELYKRFFGERHRLTYLSRGALVGEATLFDDSERSATAQAVTPCRAYSLHNDTARAFLADHPELGLAILQHVLLRGRTIEQGLLEQLVQRNLELQLHTTRLESKARRRVKDLEQSNQDLHRLAWMDPLTGCHNRRALESVVTQACKEHLPMTLAMIDVDHFKSYNDQNGHQAGDKALQTLVGLLQRRLRSDDTLARYGGEEFSLLLRHLSPDEAINVCNRLRATVAEFHFPHEEKQPNGDFTISMGLAHYPTDGDSTELLLKIADERLYQAKRGGRNRLVGGVDACV